MKGNIHEPHEERGFNEIVFDSHKEGTQKASEEKPAPVDDRDTRIQMLSVECRRLASELQKAMQKCRLLGDVVIMQAIEIKKLKEEGYDPD